jgi:5'-nucleotidase (lipoprotein e(P4) family)
MTSRWNATLALSCLFVVLAPCSLFAQTVLVPKEPPNLGKLEQQLEQYHDCKSGPYGCYATDLDRETATAIADLDRLAQRKQPTAKLAVVLDIDETALSNYAEIQQADFAYNEKAWDEWVDQAAAPAIAGTLRFYREAEKLGVAVFFITGRPESQRAVTEKNLRAVGYTQWAGLALRSGDELHMATTAYKSAERQKIVAAGYRIAVNMGDQMSDLNGTPQAEISVKLSDPFYYIP